MEHIASVLHEVMLVLAGTAFSNCCFLFLYNFWNFTGIIGLTIEAVNLILYDNS